MRVADRRLKFDATTSIANEIIEQERAARAAKTARLRETMQQAEAEKENPIQDWRSGHEHLRLPFSGAQHEGGMDDNGA